MHKNYADYNSPVSLRIWRFKIEIHDNTGTAEIGACRKTASVGKKIMEGGIGKGDF